MSTLENSEASATIEKTSFFDRWKALNEFDGWLIGNDGAGKKPYFVYRRNEGARDEYHVDQRGNAIRYTSEGALTKAEKLNITKPRAT